MSQSSIIIPFISGDGIGPEIMGAARLVANHAVNRAYGNKRKITWKATLAGQQAFDQTGTWLPEETLRIFEDFPVGLKGPLTTPVGGGFRSLNVRLRQELDLFACVRLVRWFEGLPSPLHSPSGIDLAIFRENTEDIYTGIEYEAGSSAHKEFLNGFKNTLPVDYERIPSPTECGIGIKPISKNGSQRLVRAALNWALENNRRRVTLVHKGNIMKYTEGAFRNWGYDIAEAEFSDSVFTHRTFIKIKKEDGVEVAEERKQIALSEGIIWVDDVIADVVFEQLITKPQEFDVIATTNLNGDYLSDAAAALAGGVGISPGGNINFQKGTAIFEANHGSAVDLAGKNKANPSSLILSADMMLRYIGWAEAADLIWSGIQKTIRGKTVTLDLAHQIDGSQLVGTKEFAQVIINTF
jgi:isocitrate dehydrogenase